VTPYSGDMIERIRLHDLIETHFICLTEVTRVRHPLTFHPFDNKDYKSLLRQHTKTGTHAGRFWNYIQCRTYDVRKQIAFKYPDESSGMAVSAIEQVLEELSFGLGDVREHAHWLVLERDKHGTPAKVASWLKKNCQDDVLVLEGNRKMRLSFNSDEDYLLARINFA
jgi:hypothetical protein